MMNGLQLGLWSLKERRSKADLIEMFKMFRGFTAVPRTNFFSNKLIA